MKKIFYLASLAIVFLFAGCSSDNDELGQENKENVKYENITVGVNMPGGDTRIDFNGEITTMKWADGDQLMVIGRDANGKILGDGMINIQPNFGELNATFAGTVVSADNYEFAYLGKGDNQGDAGVTYTFDYMNDCYNLDCGYNSQVLVLNGYNHVKRHMFLNSERIAKTDLKNGAKVTLNHNTSVFRFNVLDLPEEIKTASDFRISFYVNYETTSNNPVAVGNMYIYGGIPAGNTNYIYLAFDPKGHAAEQGKTIAVKFESLGTSSFGSEKPVLATCTAKATSTGKTYKAGGIYKANISTAGPGLVWEKKNNDSGTGESDYTEIYSIDFTSQSVFDGCNWLKFKGRSATTDNLLRYDATGQAIQIGFGKEEGANSALYYAYTPPMALKDTENILSITYKVDASFSGKDLDILGATGTRFAGKSLGCNLEPSTDFKTVDVTIPSTYNGKTKFYIQFKYKNPVEANFIRVKKLSVKGK